MAGNDMTFESEGDGGRPTEPDRSEEPGHAALIAGLEDKWRRALADLDNARKRHSRELVHEVEAERRRVCVAWLPVVDNLELAIEHAGDRDDPLVAGVRAVRDQAVALLQSLGFPRHDETGVPFDPVRHDVAGVVDEPGVESGTVVTVLRPGYGEPPDRQLRPAAVLVSRKQE
ncbi:MAG TPA: nucleotide exchange factor GrpE [Actinospica sp.]|nr:nucleotide exchange factor GrpE [Actinospica sp.]